MTQLSLTSFARKGLFSIKFNPNHETKTIFKKLTKIKAFEIGSRNIQKGGVKFFFGEQVINCVLEGSIHGGR